MKYIIGLSGKSGSGKDFIVNEILTNWGYHPFSMSWHLKVEAVSLGIGTYEEVFFTKPEKVRKWLQERGTENGRLIHGDDVWIRHVETWQRLLSAQLGIHHWVIPDIRFPNEVEYIHSKGGLVFRINSNRPGKLTEEQKNHASETILDNYPKFDGYLENNLDTNVLDLTDQLRKKLV